MKDTVVIDYGVGNLHSVVKALEACGAKVTVTSEAAAIAGAPRLVLPGVGAFADGMRGLRDRGLVEPVQAYARGGRPFLGICLGMQMLFTESFEFGHTQGLGLLPGKVIEIARAPGLKVPHVGWNRLVAPPGRSWTGTFLDGQPEGLMTYFVHSFYAVPEREGDRLADVFYGGHRMSAAVQAGAIVGCQFHPEKSGPPGLAMLQRFLDM